MTKENLQKMFTEEITKRLEALNYSEMKKAKVCFKLIGVFKKEFKKGNISSYDEAVEFLDKEIKKF